MARFMVAIGFCMMAAPFVVMGLEVAYANATGATGETAAQAGFWGFMLGLLTFVPGLILFVLGLIFSGR